MRGKYLRTKEIARGNCCEKKFGKGKRFGEIRALK